MVDEHLRYPRDSIKQAGKDNTYINISDSTLFLLETLFILIPSEFKHISPHFNFQGGMIRNRHFVTKDVRAKKFYQRKGSLVENDSFGMEGNLTVLGKEFMFNCSHIFVFWFLVFWSLQLHDFLSGFFLSCPSCRAKCKLRLRIYFHIFVTSLPKVTKNQK